MPPMPGRTNPEGLPGHLNIPGLRSVEFSNEFLHKTARFLRRIRSRKDDLTRKFISILRKRNPNLTR